MSRKPDKTADRLVWTGDQVVVVARQKPTRKRQTGSKKLAQGRKRQGTTTPRRRQK